MPRLDAVFDEVLELEAGEPSVETLAEGDAGGIRVAGADHLQVDEQVDGRGEEGRSPRRGRLDRAPERRVSDVLEQEESLAGAG